MKWINCFDELPENGMKCLGFCIVDTDDPEITWQGIIEVIFFYRTGWKRTEWELGKDCKSIFVTHWTEYPNNPFVLD